MGKRQQPKERHFKRATRFGGVRRECDVCGRLLSTDDLPFGYLRVSATRVRGHRSCVGRLRRELEMRTALDAQRVGDSRPRP